MLTDAKRETEVSALGKGEGGAALPKAFLNADLSATQAKYPGCLRYTSEPSRLRPGNHVALRLIKAASQAEGTFSPFLKGPYVIVNVNPAGVAADIRCLATGHMATVNRCFLKFLEAIPQHALHLKHLPRAVFR